MKRLILMILSILLLTGCSTDADKNNPLIETNESMDSEAIILDEHIEDEIILQTAVPTASPEVKEKVEAVSTSAPEAEKTLKTAVPDQTAIPTKEPKLHYLKRDISIQSLIAMRFDENSGMKREKFVIEFSESSGIKAKDAIKIDGALKALKVSSDTSIATEVKRESRKFFEYEIEF